MARSRRPVKNPSIPRLEWVAKTYPDWVWVYTVQGFMLASGMDAEASRMADSADAFASDNSFEEAAGSPVTSIPDELSDMVGRDIVLAGTASTEYDRYIPWLAKRLNEYGKAPIKRVRRIMKEVYPDMILPPSAGISESPGQIDVDPFRWSRSGEVRHAVDSLGWSEQVEVRELLEDAASKCEALALQFGSIVNWARETRVNLDDYNGDEAREAAMHWAENRPKGDVVPGEVVYEFADGWTFQELSTKKQLECEGVEVDHCVKHYSPSKIGVKYRIFSLRDPDGHPKVTMEWNVPGEYVSQYKGLSNSAPDKDAVERAVEFRLNYIDKNLVSDDKKLEQASHYSEYFPAYVGEFKGGFKGVYAPAGSPEMAVAVYKDSMVPASDIRRHVDMVETDVYQELGAGDSIAADEEVLRRIRETDAMDAWTGDMEGWEDQAWLAWPTWKLFGAAISSSDELVDEIGSYEIRPPAGASANPRKRKAKRKTPEWKRLLDRSHRLWETYDAKPLKKNLVAFGAHIEKMKTSASLKVKTEARRAERAFNAEFKARGWKR